jgi:hypothetical protein
MEMMNLKLVLTATPAAYAAVSIKNHQFFRRQFADAM